MFCPAFYRIELSSQLTGGRNLGIGMRQLSLQRAKHGQFSSLVHTLQASSHWHDKRFTPWHAIWRADDGITCDSVPCGCVGMRDDAGVLARAMP